MEINNLKLLMKTYVILSSKNNTKNHIDCKIKQGHYDERNRKCDIFYWPHTMCIRIQKSLTTLKWENFSNSKNRAEGCAFRTELEKNSSMWYEHKTNNLEVWDKMNLRERQDKIEFYK